MTTSQSPSTRLLGRWRPSELLLEPKPELYLVSQNFIVLDFETFGPDYGDASNPETGLLLACYWDSATGRQEVCWGDEYHQNKLLERVKSADFIVAHNAKYELKWLYRMGVDLRTVLPYCTQIGEYVIAGNRKLRGGLGLDATAYRRFGLRKKGFVKASLEADISTLDIPKSALIEYCAQDVELTGRIFFEQREQLNSAGLLNVHYGRNIVTPALSEIEFRGLYVDESRVNAEYTDVIREYDAAARDLDGITGGINFRSAKQLREVIYNRFGFSELRNGKGEPIRTRKDQPKTDKGTIGLLVARSDDQREFKRAFGRIAPLKKRKQILENLKAACEKDGGYVFASFNQTVTQTHRLSSSGGKWGFQFHNFPRRYKSLFKARKDGWLCCETDGAQLEFRVAVDLGNDAQGKRDILGGVDIHKLSADTLGVDRQTAKAYTFKPLYGGFSGTDRERRYYEAFRARYADIYRTQNSWVYEVLRNGCLRTATGLVLYWSDTEVQRSGYITNTPSIFNYPVQMFATADIIPIILALLWHSMAGMESFITNTVHDSVIAEVHPDELGKYGELVQRAFIEDIYKVLYKLYNYKFSTPFGAEIKAGTHWGEGAALKMQADMGRIEYA